MQLNQKKYKATRISEVSRVGAKIQLNTHLGKTEFEEVVEFSIW